MPGKAVLQRWAERPRWPPEPALRSGTAGGRRRFRAIARPQEPSFLLRFLNLLFALFIAPFLPSLFSRRSLAS